VYRLKLTIRGLLIAYLLAAFGLEAGAAASQGESLDKEFYQELDRGSGGGGAGSRGEAASTVGEARATSYLSYFLGLALLVGAAGAIAYMLRLLARRGRTAPAEENRGLLEVIAQAPIGKDKYISLVEVADRVLVLGVGEGSINLLAEIDDKEAIDTIKIRRYAGGNKHNRPFSDYLKNIFAGRSQPRTGSQGRKDSDPSSDYVQEQRKRLNDLSIR
jgi:flagellar protein FliO/FliZ